MGKYLQNVQFRHDPLVGKERLLEEAQKISADLKVIETYFNKHLPKKIEIGNQIWRFIIMLTPIADKNRLTEVIGLCQDYYVYIDYKKILGLQSSERRKELLNIFVLGIKRCCEANNYKNDLFQHIYEKVKEEMEREAFKD
ncbi:hypothetical protein [Hymenobacter radiodurans]|uniref:hypothetical protein n=1 Tax=Hymenobacter radiodurans TaxID=2496028 RepID=UPI001058C172|nr:hypothetical protein [Hymenobacter radiodurans]